MAGIKPTDFQNVTPTGTTEIYTQTGGINGKFTVGDVKNYIEANLASEWTEVVVDVTSGEVLAMYTTPIGLLPNPGVGKYYLIDYFIIELIAGSAGYVGGLGAIIFTLDGMYQGTFPDIIGSGVDSVATMFRMGVSTLINSPFALTASENPTLGDGTLKVKIKYKINTFG